MWHTLAYAVITLSTLSTVSIAYSPGRPCPEPCDAAGNNPTNWTDLHGVRALKKCEEPVLFDTAIFTPIDASYSPLTLRACTASNKVVIEEVEYSPAPFTFGSSLERRANLTNTSNSTSPRISNSTLKGCVSNAETFTNKTEVSLLRWNADAYSAQGGGKAAVLSAAEALKTWLSVQDDCEPSVMMARHGDAVVGIYVGTEAVVSSALPIVEKFISAMDAGSDMSRFAAQACRADAPAPWTIGVYADFRGNISATQEAIRTWAEGKCLTGANSQDGSETFDVTYVLATSVPVRTGLLSGLEQVNEPVEPFMKRDLVARAECKPIQVDAGEGCVSLAQRCGVKQKDLESYNPRKNFCDTLKNKEWVCCSKGDLPDMGPKPNPDGSCASYRVEKLDFCYTIAQAHEMNVTKFDEYNKKTWGWGGCEAMQPGDIICLSKGDPPMPSPLTGAMCGPRKEGTVRPTNGTDLKDLNPCPLKVCCNFWGQCGISEDFCILDPADTKAPGTTQPGKNSCVASCGMNITNNDKAPSQFRKIAYFEAWNSNRPCLHMDVTDIDTKKFTHVHFAFPNITNDFQVDMGTIKGQFEKLKGMKDIKRIVSFGGWAFSTDPGTFSIFRQGVTDANRATLATNIAKFVTDNGLDGVDFDWEYPSAPDIPGIPAGAEESGRQYLEFLKLVKRRLTNKEVAIAAPASYWYLKGMPIADISKVVDYIVYMTYDLHGQWDYDNKWASPGCESGNCLRSHVNKTETEMALAMVTKAGVSSTKIIVGVSSYGRSFHMEEPGCDGPNCKFTGSSTESDAMKGKCTDTGGYISNAEIRDILADSNGGIGYKVKKWHDKGSDSDIMVYNDEEWVAYMDDSTKDSRTTWYKGLNFGGTSDWAVDLDHDFGDFGVGETDPEKVEMGGGPVCDKEKDYKSLDKIADDDNLHPLCAQVYALFVLNDMLKKSMVKYNVVNDGYDAKFKSYIKYMKKGLPASLAKYMDWLNGEGQRFFDCTFKGNGDNWTGPCPVPRSVRGGLLIGIWTIDMKLRDKKGFYEELYNKTGIMEDWIRFDTYEEETMCNPSPCNKLELKVFNMPYLKDDYTIPNPKDVVSKAMGNSGNLQTQLVARTLDVGMGNWMGNNSDVLTSLSIPVFLIENAIEGMEDAKELGEEYDREVEKQKILLILSLVFLIVPFLGEAAAIAAGAVTMARVMAIVAASANVGLALQEIIENPEMAPFAIVELLTAGRLRTPKNYADAANFREFMKASDIKTLGEKFVKQDGMIRKIVKRCG